MTNTPRLTFIGAGNMARAIIGGLRANEYPQSALAACAPVPDELAWINQHFEIATHPDNNRYIADSDALVLCVKPQIMRQVCEGLKDNVQHYQPLIISIAAGITTKQLESWLGGSVAVIRSMPNTPAQVHMGATGMYANSRVTATHKALAQQLFEAVGIALWVAKEEDLHTVTALSGSGPAYCFLFLDALQQAAQRLGLPTSVCHDLAIQTMRGAAELASNSEENPAQLMRKVMSPGGTTERAIARFEQDGFTTMVTAAVQDAWARSYELAGDNIPDETINT